MSLPSQIFIPSVPFFGRLRDKTGHWLNGEAALYPMSSTRTFMAGDYMFGMRNYHFTIENGYFYIDVLPNDFGVETPWLYTFDTPEKIWRVALDSNGPHDFTQMLARTGRYA